MESDYCVLDLDKIDNNEIIKAIHLANCSICKDEYIGQINEINKKRKSNSGITLCLGVS